VEVSHRRYGGGLGHYPGDKRKAGGLVGHGPGLVQGVGALGGVVGLEGVVGLQEVEVVQGLALRLSQPASPPQLLRLQWQHRV
jgi:hypothetical protein